MSTLVTRLWRNPISSNAEITISVLYFVRCAHLYQRDHFWLQHILSCVLCCAVDGLLSVSPFIRHNNPIEHEPDHVRIRITRRTWIFAMLMHGMTAVMVVQSHNNWPAVPRWHLFSLKYLFFLVHIQYLKAQHRKTPCINCMHKYGEPIKRTFTPTVAPPASFLRKTINNMKKKKNNKKTTDNWGKIKQQPFWK